MSLEGSTFDPLSTRTVFRGRLDDMSTMPVEIGKGAVRKSRISDGAFGADAEPSLAPVETSPDFPDAVDSLRPEEPSDRLSAETVSRIDELHWVARYRMLKRLGNGAQGVVYLANRDGADGYETKVAVKLFFRERTGSREEYLREMRRVALQAQRISEIQNDNIVTVRDFVEIDDTRVMVMEWVDGLDLRALLDSRRHRQLKNRLGKSDWQRLNDVVVSPGRDHCRLKPGIAVDIIRGCLAGLSDLHHNEIVHCDLKPSNIMIKRSGTKKIIDLDSSCRLTDSGETVLRGTPYYMAPEQLRARSVSYASDIASLGYVLVEMLAGEQLFRRCRSIEDLIEAKMTLPDRLESYLPAAVMSDSSLFRLCRKMIALDPAERFEDADAADLDRHGAANFHRHLIKADMSTEYDRELAWWLDGLLGDPIRR